VKRVDVLLATAVIPGPKTRRGKQDDATTKLRERQIMMALPQKETETPVDDVSRRLETAFCRWRKTRTNVGVVFHRSRTTPSWPSP
jgi:hypothetical protein